MELFYLLFDWYKKKVTETLTFELSAKTVIPQSSALGPLHCGQISQNKTRQNPLSFIAQYRRI